MTSNAQKWLKQKILSANSNPAPKYKYLCVGYIGLVFWRNNGWIWIMEDIDKHTGLSMYMVPLKKWWQHGQDSNFTISISLYSKPSFDEGLFFAIFYWKAVQGLKHIYVVKNKVQK